MTHVPRAARGLLVVLVVAAATTSSPARAAVPAAGCAGPARAVVIVDTGDNVHRSVICFSGSVSGLAALQSAGANPVTYGFSGQGAAVCALYGVGNPATQESCLIDPASRYWAYFRAAPGAGGFSYSRAGASSTTVTDGSVEGWRYGTGQAPPFSSFCAVAGCAPLSTAAPVPAPTGTSPPPVEVAPGTANRGGGNGSGAPTTVAPPSDGSSGQTEGSTGTSTTAPGADGDGRDGQRGDGTKLAAGAAGSGGSGGDDGGSPVGVLAAVGFLAVLAGTGVWLRRRRSGAGTG